MLFFLTVFAIAVHLLVGLSHSIHYITGITAIYCNDLFIQRFFDEGICLNNIDLYPMCEGPRPLRGPRLNPPPIYLYKQPGHHTYVAPPLRRAPLMPMPRRGGGAFAFAVAPAVAPTVCHAQFIPEAQAFLPMLTRDTLSFVHRSLPINGIDDTVSLHLPELLRSAESIDQILLYIQCIYTTPYSFSGFLDYSCSLYVMISQ